MSNFYFVAPTDYIPTRLYKAYWEDIIEEKRDLIDRWLKGTVPHLFVSVPVEDEIRAEDFLSYLAEAAVAQSSTHRSIEQSVVYAEYPRNSSDRDRQEFFYEPVRTAHFYNDFVGVHVIFLSEWTDLPHLQRDADFTRLCRYIKDTSRKVRFIFWERSGNSTDRLREALPCVFLPVLDLPKPTNEQFRRFMEQEMLLNHILPDEETVSFLHEHCVKGASTDHFIQISTAVSFLREHVNSATHKPTETGMALIQQTFGNNRALSNSRDIRIGF